MTLNAMLRVCTKPWESNSVPDDVTHWVAAQRNAALRGHVAAPPVKPMDETGLRIGDQTRWRLVASVLWLTFYRTSAKPGGLFKKVKGIVDDDHGKTDATLRGVTQALCDAHHLS